YFQSQKPVMPPAGNGNNGPYQYDGGPLQPMPMPLPSDGPDPTFQPKRPVVPLDGKLVSIPAKAPAITYPAYGEQLPVVPAVRQPAPGTRFVSLPTAGVTKLRYPAYGER